MAINLPDTPFLLMQAELEGLLWKILHLTLQPHLAHSGTFLIYVDEQRHKLPDP